MKCCSDTTFIYLVTSEVRAVNFILTFTALRRDGGNNEENAHQQDVLFSSEDAKKIANLKNFAKKRWGEGILF